MSLAVVRIRCGVCWKLNCELTMSEKRLKSETILNMGEFVKPRKYNKFSIENILGLNEGDKANRVSNGKDFVPRNLVIT